MISYHSGVYWIVIWDLFFNRMMFFIDIKDSIWTNLFSTVER